MEKPRMAKILLPLPGLDCDPTETAIPWQILTERGHDVVFATPNGEPSQPDDIMLTGRGLDLWGWIPGFRRFPLIGRLLAANKHARRAFQKMSRSQAFLTPLRWDEIDARQYDGLILPGGHRARGIRPYLESKDIQNAVIFFFKNDKAIGAICHGALIPARSIDPETQRSVLFGRKTTGLTWQLEGTGARIGRFVRFWDPHYYRTYLEEPGQPPGYMSVEHEIIRSLEHATDFLDVPPDAEHYKRKTSGLARDTMMDQSASWVVQDGNYVTARWPGDAHAFAIRFAGLLTA
jgi:putative intracellular protease/amidase